MKTVLLLVHDDKGQVARLEAALHLVKAFDGHLSCMDVSILPMPVGDHLTVTGPSEIREEQARESRNKARLTEILANENVRWDWKDVVGDCAEALIDGAMLADLIVVNRRLNAADGPDMRAIASETSLRARAPVLALPDDWIEPAFNRAIIAWDGRAACAATLRACVPLLEMAQDVQLFELVDHRGGRVRPAEAAAYLKRYGVHAEIRTLRKGHAAADQEIEAAAAAFDADYVLMGSHNHGRLRELFGSVSSRMLGNAKVPLVLGH